MKHILIVPMLLLALTTPAAAQFDRSNFNLGAMFTTNIFGEDRPELAIIDGLVDWVAVDADATLRVIGGMQVLYGWDRFKIGPSINVAPGSDEVIDQIGGGVTFAFFGEDGGIGINVGGWVNPNAQFPLERYVVGQPPPDGATEIRTFRKTTYALAISVSWIPGKPRPPAPPPRPPMPDPPPPPEDRPEVFTPLDDPSDVP